MRCTMDLEADPNHAHATWRWRVEEVVGLLCDFCRATAQVGRLDGVFLPIKRYVEPITG